MLVADAPDGSDTNLVIAALVHDAIEDCKVPRELIAWSFGEDVAAIVEEVAFSASIASSHHTQHLRDDPRCCDEEPYYFFNKFTKYISPRGSACQCSKFAKILILIQHLSNYSIAVSLNRGVLRIHACQL
jgi:(p)ppGpp synthase/HD superfamily hydrolase